MVLPFFVFALVFLVIHKFTEKEEAPYLCQIRFVRQSEVFVNSSLHLLCQKSNV